MSLIGPFKWSNLVVETKLMRRKVNYSIKNQVTRQKGRKTLQVKRINQIYFTNLVIGPLRCNIEYVKGTLREHWTKGGEDLVIRRWSDFSFKQRSLTSSQIILLRLTSLYLSVLYEPLGKSFPCLMELPWLVVCVWSFIWDIFWRFYWSCFLGCHLFRIFYDLFYVGFKQRSSFLCLVRATTWYH